MNELILTYINKPLIKIENDLTQNLKYEKIINLKTKQLNQFFNRIKYENLYELIRNYNEVLSDIYE